VNETAWAVATFRDIVSDLLALGKGSDFLQIALSNENAPGYSITTPIARQQDFDIDALLVSAAAGAQSCRNFSTGGVITVLATRVDTVEGCGLRSDDNSFVWERFKCIINPKCNNGYHRSALLKERVKSGKHYVTIETNNYCGVIAFYIGIMYWQHQRNGSDVARKKYNDACLQKSVAFAQAIDEIMEKCELDLETRGMDNTDWQKLQFHYPDVKIHVHNGVEYEDLLFEGSPPSTFTNIITILYDQGHYAFCSTPATLFKFRYQCPDCDEKYLQKGRHVCKQTCVKCGFKDCGGQKSENDRALLSCRKCFLPFYSEKCYEKHLEVVPDARSGQPRCATYKKCKFCNVCYSLLHKNRHGHVCGEIYCTNCACMQPRGHLCYITKSKDSKADVSKQFLIFYDLETTQHKLLPGSTDKYIQETVLVCASTVCYKCHDIKNLVSCDNCGVRNKIIHKFDDPTKNVAKEFVNWAYKKGRGLCDGARQLKGRTVYLYAHNSRSFDGQFLMSALGADEQFEIKFVVMNGRKIMRAESTRDSVKLVLLDFLNFVSQPLNSLCKAFKLSIDSKGSFPVFFIDPKNYNYNECKLPPKKYWCPDAMSVKQRAEFEKWHEETNEFHVTTATPWNFKEECINYCVTDVAILMQAALAYRNGMMSTLNFDPLTNKTTIASTCLHIYRRFFMPANSIGNFFIILLYFTCAFFIILLN
jgi:hypothetical protein